MILQFLFIVRDLRFHFVNRVIQSGDEVFLNVVGDEFVLVFRSRYDFHFLCRVLQVHSHDDESQPVKIVQQFLGFVADFGLVFHTQMPMSGGDFYFHNQAPSYRVAKRRKSPPAHHTVAESHHAKRLYPAPEWHSTKHFGEGCSKTAEKFALDMLNDAQPHIMTKIV
jgi:hypothetical protein